MKLLSSLFFLLVIGCSSRAPGPPIQHSLDNYQNKGSSFYYQGKFGSALRAYQQSLHLAEVLNNPLQIAEHSIRIANIYRHRQQFPEAKQYYQYALQNITPETFENLSDDAMSRVYFSARYGLVQLALIAETLTLGETQEGTRLLQSVPNDSTWKNKLIVDLKVTDALLLKNRGEYHAAQSKLDQAEQIIQENRWIRKLAAIWLNRANISYLGKDYDLAREQSEKALTIDQQQENLMGIRTDLSLLKRIAIIRQNDFDQQSYQRRIDYIDQRILE